EVVGFETQPEAFDGIEVRAVSGEERSFEMMPAEAAGSLPGGVIEDEDAPVVRVGGMASAHRSRKHWNASVSTPSKSSAKRWPVLGRTAPTTLVRTCSPK